MKAAITPNYGPADVLQTREMPVPAIGPRDVLIEVRSTDVTAGDRRMRAADFPSITAVPGRLMMGLRRPRNNVQGTMFAGRIAQVGSAVTRHAVGDDVFGSTDHGAYAEYLVMAEDGAMAKMPAALSYEQAAAVPYGAGTALYFLRQLGAVQPGERVLIVGASGGVGRFAVQLARHFGADVTGVCSRANFELVRGLGAHRVIDHHTEDFTASGERYDVIFDIAGVTSFSASKHCLTATGRYLTLYMTVGVMLQMAWTSLRGGRRAKFGIALGNRERTEELRDLMAQGALKPVIARRYPLDSIIEAHADADTRKPSGSVVVTMQPVMAAQHVESGTRTGAAPECAIRFSA